MGRNRARGRELKKGFAIGWNQLQRENRVVHQSSKSIWLAQNTKQQKPLPVSVMDAGSFCITGEAAAGLAVSFSWCGIRRRPRRIALAFESVPWGLHPID
jgi:hypothetical protein